MSSIQIVIPPELMAICITELSEFVEVGFDKYFGGTDSLYYEYYTIKTSENALWERARNLNPPATRIIIEQVLFKLGKNGGVIIPQVPGQPEETNDDRLEYICRCAVGKYVQRKFQEYLQAHPE